MSIEMKGLMLSFKMQKKSFLTIFHGAIKGTREYLVTFGHNPIVPSSCSCLVRACARA
jgi:hypothetical protein